MSILIKLIKIISMIKIMKNYHNVLIKFKSISINQVDQNIFLHKRVYL
jgi:hypothetical protein